MDNDGIERGGWIVQFGSEGFIQQVAGEIKLPFESGDFILRNLLRKSIRFVEWTGKLPHLSGLERESAYCRTD